MLRMKNKTKKKTHWIYYFLGFMMISAFFGSIIYKSFIIPYELKYYGRYTIAYPNSITVDSKGGKSVECKFYVNDKIYFASFGTISPSREIPLHNFYVKFSTRNPNMRQVNSKSFVPYKIEKLTQPKFGWSEAELKKLDDTFQPF